jgi:predicted dehydrogenase
MARSFAECQKMLEAFDRARKPLFVAYYRRMLPRFIAAKDSIDSGVLGKVTGCRYRLTKKFNPSPKHLWRLDPEQSGGGLFLDIGSHVLDILDHLLGKFVEFSGSAASVTTSGVEDNVAVSFRTESGTIGSASWNFAGPADEELLEIDGTLGRMSTQVINHSALNVNHAGTGIADPRHVQQPLIQTVVDELLGRGKCPSTGASAARTSKVMDAALTRFYGGRDDDFWERCQRRLS